MSIQDFNVDLEEDMLPHSSTTTRISVDLDAISVSKIKGWIQTPPDFRKRKKFVDGDHWQGGEGWVGPLPPRDQPDERRDALDRIRKAFTSQNACREVVERHADAVAGNDPLWTYSANEEDVDVLNLILQTWWRDHKLHKLIHKTLTLAKWSERAFLRRVIPPSRVEDVLVDPLTDEVFTIDDIDNLSNDRAAELEPAQVVLKVPFIEAINMIHVELVEPNKGAIVRDSETLRDYGCYIYKVGNIDHAEVSYVDDDGFTHLLIISGSQIKSDVSFDLGGQLLHHEVSLGSLVTVQVMQLQRMLNKAYTMASTNMDWSGFTERVFLNAQWPYRIDTDAQGKKTRVPIDFQTGAATTNWVVGVTMEDPTTGKKTLTQPEIKWRQPSDPTVFDYAKMMAYRGILQECRQLHALITGEATTTGESRKQALVEFNKSLEPTKTEADILGQWLIDGQVRFASVVSTQSIVPSGADLKFQTIIEVGGIDANEVRLWSEVRDKGGVTHKSFLSKLGVEDVDAEVRAVEEDPVYKAERMASRLEQLKKVLDLNIDIVTAMKLLNFTEEEISILQSATSLQDTDIDL